MNARSPTTRRGKRPCTIAYATEAGVRPGVLFRSVSGLCHVVNLWMWKTHAIGSEKLLHASFQARRWLGKPCSIQFAHVCLRKILILTAQRCRHVNIADAERAPQRVTHGQNHIVKGAHDACPLLNSPHTWGCCHQQRRSAIQSGHRRNHAAGHHQGLRHAWTETA